MSRGPELLRRSRRIMARPDLVLTELEYPLTLVTGNATTAGLQITFNEFVDIAQQGIQVVDKFGTVRWAIPPAGGPAVFGSCVRVANAPGGAWAGFRATIGDVQDTPCIELPDGTSAQGARIYGGTAPSGAPGANQVGVSRVGDLFIKKRTNAGSLLWFCTVAGNPGTYVSLD